MANTARRGADASRIPERHGATGEVLLSIGVHPHVKDAVVDHAAARGVTIKSLVVAAIEKELGLA